MEGRDRRETGSAGRGRRDLPSMIFSLELLAPCSYVVKMFILFDGEALVDRYVIFHHICDMGYLTDNLSKTNTRVQPREEIRLNNKWEASRQVWRGWPVR